jgi:hypothetical protein
VRPKKKRLVTIDQLKGRLKIIIKIHFVEGDETSKAVLSSPTTGFQIFLCQKREKVISLQSSAACATGMNI